MVKGIYKITNNRTGEEYIGQTNNLYFREKQHMEDLANGTHHNRGMQQDYNRGDTFSFEVLEYVDGTREELHEREKAQIRNHNSFYAGYNQTPCGEYDQLKGSYQYGGGRKLPYFNSGFFPKSRQSGPDLSKNTPYTNYEGPRPKISCLPKYYSDPNYKQKFNNNQQKKSKNDGFSVLGILFGIIILIIFIYLSTLFPSYSPGGLKIGSSPFLMILGFIVSVSVCAAFSD